MGTMLPQFNSDKTLLLNQSKISAAIDGCLPLGSTRRFIITEAVPKVSIGMAITTISLLTVYSVFKYSVIPLGHKIIEVSVGEKHSSLHDKNNLDASIIDFIIGSLATVALGFVAVTIAVCGSDRYNAWKREQKAEVERRQSIAEKIAHRDV